MPGQQRPWRDREHFGPPRPRHRRRQGREPRPIHRLVAHSRDLTAQRSAPGFVHDCCFVARQARRSDHLHQRVQRCMWPGRTAASAPAARPTTSSSPPRPTAPPGRPWPGSRSARPPAASTTSSPASAWTRPHRALDEQRKCSTSPEENGRTRQPAAPTSAVGVWSGHPRRRRVTTPPSDALALPPPSRSSSA